MYWVFFLLPVSVPPHAAAASRSAKTVRPAPHRVVQQTGTKRTGSTVEDFIQTSPQETDRRPPVVPSPPTLLSLLLIPLFWASDPPVTSDALSCFYCERRNRFFSLSQNRVLSCERPTRKQKKKSGLSGEGEMAIYLSRKAEWTQRSRRSSAVHQVQTLELRFYEHIGDVDTFIQRWCFNDVVCQLSTMKTVCSCFHGTNECLLVLSTARRLRWNLYADKHPVKFIVNLLPDLKHFNSCKSLNEQQHRYVDPWLVHCFTLCFHLLNFIRPFCLKMSHWRCSRLDPLESLFAKERRQITASKRQRTNEVLLTVYTSTHTQGKTTNHKPENTKIYEQVLLLLKCCVLIKNDHFITFPLLSESNVIVTEQWRNSINTNKWELTVIHIKTIFKDSKKQLDKKGIFMIKNPN